MNVLFIGGTGTISASCAETAVNQGINLYLFNRGISGRPVPQGAHLILGDIGDRDSVGRGLGKIHFDAVVDWVVYTPDQVERDIELFRDRAGQYVFISSASAYQKPLSLLPITESTPLANPYWAYSRAKIACEERLMQAYRSGGFPVTIVRPSHTYDRRHIPLTGGYTVIDRMRRGKKVIVHGDGSSLWVLTHAMDFAKGFTGLLGNPHALGEAFQITSDELLTWNQIFSTLAAAAGVEVEPVHVPSDLIHAYDPDWGDGLLGDKAYSVIFDNTKIKRAVPGYVATIPFARGAREIMDWHDADPARHEIDEGFNRLVDRILAGMESARPSAA